MKTNLESYQNLSLNELNWLLKDTLAVMKLCKKCGDMETYHNKLRQRRTLQECIKNYSESTESTEPIENQSPEKTTKKISIIDTLIKYNDFKHKNLITLNEMKQINNIYYRLIKKKVSLLT